MESLLRPAPFGQKLAFALGFVAVVFAAALALPLMFGETVGGRGDSLNALGLMYARSSGLAVAVDTIVTGQAAAVLAVLVAAFAAAALLRISLGDVAVRLEELREDRERARETLALVTAHGVASMPTARITIAICTVALTLGVPLTVGMLFRAAGVSPFLGPAAIFGAVLVAFSLGGRWWPRVSTVVGVLFVAAIARLARSGRRVLPPVRTGSCPCHQRVRRPDPRTGGDIARAAVAAMPRAVVDGGGSVHDVDEPRVARTVIAEAMISQNGAKPRVRAPETTPNSSRALDPGRPR